MFHFISSEHTIAHRASMRDSLTTLHFSSSQEKIVQFVNILNQEKQSTLNTQKSSHTKVHLNLARRLLNYVTIDTSVVRASCQPRACPSSSCLPSRHRDRKGDNSRPTSPRQGCHRVPRFFPPRNQNSLRS